MIRSKSIITELYNSKKVGIQLKDEQLSQLQSHLFDMYKEIEAICVRHNLKVCIAYGNVLGAIRHNGWIPWDDDLDIHMPREDYEIFLTNYYKELPEKYRVSSYLSSDGPIARFAKIIDTSTVFVPVMGEKNEYSGVFLDIFPIDNIGSNRIINSLKKYWQYFLMYTASSVFQVERNSQSYKEIMYSTKTGKKNWQLRQLLGRVFSFASSRTWHRWIEEFWIIRNKTGYVHVKSAMTMCGMRVPSEVFYPFKRMHTSAGDVFVPNDAEKYLDIIYGEWRKIPDIQHREHHFIKEIVLPKKFENLK